jgi:hypothetical protein
MHSPITLFLAKLYHFGKQKQICGIILPWFGEKQIWIMASWRGFSQNSNLSFESKKYFSKFRRKKHFYSNEQKVKTENSVK